MLAGLGLVRRRLLVEVCWGHAHARANGLELRGEQVRQSRVNKGVDGDIP